MVGAVLRLVRQQRAVPGNETAAATLHAVCRQRIDFAWADSPCADARRYRAMYDGPMATALLFNAGAACGAVDVSRAAAVQRGGCDRLDNAIADLQFDEAVLSADRNTRVCLLPRTGRDALREK